MCGTGKYICFSKKSLGFTRKDVGFGFSWKWLFFSHFVLCLDSCDTKLHLVMFDGLSLLGF